MRGQPLQDFPAFRAGEVQGDGLLVAAFMDEGAAAQISVDIVFEHVTLAPERGQLAQRRPSRGFHHDDIGPKFPQVAARLHGAHLEAPMAALQHPNFAPRPRVSPSHAGDGASPP